MMGPNFDLRQIDWSATIGSNNSHIASPIFKSILEYLVSFVINISLKRKLGVSSNLLGMIQNVIRFIRKKKG